MALPIDFNAIRDYAVATGVEGGAMYASDRIFREAMKNAGFVSAVVKNLKQWSEPILFWGISLAVWILAGNRIPQLAARAIRAAGSLGIMKAIGYGIRDYPFAVLIDAQTLEVFNLDPNATVKVIIDGSEVSFQTAPATDGNGYAKITLPSALDTTKTHKILVHTGFKAVYIETAVPS